MSLSDDAVPASPPLTSPACPDTSGLARGLTLGRLHRRDHRRPPPRRVRRPARTAGRAGRAGPGAAHRAASPTTSSCAPPPPLVDDPPTIVFVSTGIGLRGWLEAAEGWGARRGAHRRPRRRLPDRPRRQGPGRAAGGRPGRPVVAGLGVAARRCWPTCSSAGVAGRARSPSSCTATTSPTSRPRCARPAPRWSRSRSTAGCRRPTRRRCAA